MRYVRVIAERWKIVLACLLAVLIGTGVYVATASKKYQATAQMLISPINPSDNYTVGLPVLHSSGDPTTDTLTAASVIKTEQVAAAVVAQLRLHESVRTLLGDITTAPIGGSNLISIKATSASAAGAQSIANAVVTQVVKTRAAALHAALDVQIPALKAQVRADTAAELAANPGLSAELAELQQLSTGNDPTITPASSAQLPAAPSSPKTKLALVAGLLGGLIIGIAVAFGVDALDPRLRREGQIRELLGLRVLAHIPSAKPRLPWRVRRRRGPMLPADLTVVAREGYRVLRMVLESGAHRDARSYLLTGCTPAEGKTTSAINLAGSLAQTGARVILIELDLRRPVIGRALNLKVAHGTEHVITGRTELADALIKVSTGDVQFDALIVRSPNTQLADSLSFEIVSELVAQARLLADYVIIDAPPLTSVSDALPLLHVVDDVVIVARIGVSPLTRLTRLQEMLSSQGAPIAGVLLIGESSPRGQDYYHSAPVKPIGSADEIGSASSPELRLGSGPASRR